MTEFAKPSAEVVTAGEIWARESGALPAVVLYGGPCERGVLVGANGLGMLRLRSGGGEYLIAPDTTAMEVTDIAAREVLLAAVLAGVLRAGEQQQRNDALTDHKASEVEHTAAAQRAATRAQLLRWAHAGQLTWDDVNAHLRELGMDVYRPTVEVTFRITGKFDIATDDVGHAGPAVDDVGVDLSRVCGLVSGSGDWQVKLLEATRVDPDAPGQQP